MAWSWRFTMLGATAQTTSLNLNISSAPLFDERPLMIAAIGSRNYLAGHQTLHISKSAVSWCINRISSYVNINIHPIKKWVPARHKTQSTKAQPQYSSNEQNVRARVSWCILNILMQSETEEIRNFWAREGDRLKHSKNFIEDRTLYVRVEQTKRKRTILSHQAVGSAKHFTSSSIDHSVKESPFNPRLFHFRTTRSTCVSSQCSCLNIKKFKIYVLTSDRLLSKISTATRSRFFVFFFVFWATKLQRHSELTIFQESCYLCRVSCKKIKK